MRRTGSVVRKFERRSSLLDIDVEDVVVLYSVVELPSIRTDGVDDLSNLLPRAGGPLRRGRRKVSETRFCDEK